MSRISATPRSHPAPLVERLGPRGFATAMLQRFRAILAAPEGSDTVRELVEVARDAFGDNLDRVPPPEPIACRRGCAWCCATRVAATPPEILSLARFLRDQIDEPSLAARTRRLAEEDAAWRALDDEARAGARRWCALLGPDSACTAYSARPLSCRAVFAFDAGACADNHAGRRAEVIYFGAPVQIRMAIQLPLMAALREAGLAWSLADLPIALRIAMERADCEAAWRAGEDVFADAALPDTRFDPRQLDRIAELAPRPR